MPSAFKSILPLSNAPFALSALLVPTTCGLISELTLMSVPSFAQCVAKHSPASTIGSATKACTLVRRNSFAKENSSKAASGVVVAASHVLMH